MTANQVLQSVTYLSWAFDFVLLGVALAIGTVSYRALAHRARPASARRIVRVRSPIRASGSAPGRLPSVR